PDMQEMRMHARLLALKARVEIAEGDYTSAARTLETGFSFSQQVSEAPFLINSLVGVACEHMMADAVADLMQRPDGPNLSWSLAARARRLIDLRRGMDLEHRVMELEFPDLADLERPRTAEQWEAVVKKVHDKMNLLDGGEGVRGKTGEPLPADQEVQA